MSGQGNAARTEVSRRQAAAQGRAEGLNIGWTVFSYLLSGMAAYGLIGWLVGRAVHVSLLFPIGMLIGLGISIGFIIYRYGRGGLGGTASPQDRRRGVWGERLPPRIGGVTGGSSPRGRKGDDR
jgi:F0F1-type ATP synthase assembly protein I